MLTNPHFSSARLDSVLRRIEIATAAAARPSGAVTLIGVTKTQPAPVVSAAIAAGLRDLGENYLQEAVPKIEALAAQRDAVQWHYIGQIQSNKTRPIAELFDWVHTVDRLKIAERLAAQRPFHGPELNVCLQVNIGSEISKGGARPDELLSLARGVAALPRLRLRGLMCIPPESDSPQVQRGHFAALRQLRDTLIDHGFPLDTLSMGMSGDLEAAIMEGATHVRVGTAIFGERMKR
jgi:pyridoxal phosphate enzyme (YggS family)